MVYGSLLGQPVENITGLNGGMSTLKDVLSIKSCPRSSSEMQGLPSFSLWPTSVSSTGLHT